MSLHGLPSLSELADQLREGKVRAIDLVETAIEGREGSADELGPYKTWDPGRSRRQALAVDAAFEAGIDSGPLQGLPVSVKDLFGVPGWPTYAGTAMRLPGAWEQAGPVVRAATRQLCVVMGKTHTVELAFGGLGTNPHWGTPRNPWDDKHHRVPGGSSAGAGVSLVEGSALLAFGTDTAGSVRIPASMTGTVGLKTSYGRWPTDGVVPLSSSLDSVGMLARTVRDIAYGFKAIEAGLWGVGPTLRTRSVAGCRIGVPKELFWDDASAGVAEAVRSAIEVLEKAGALIDSVSFAPAVEAYDIFLQGGLAGAEVAAFLSESLPEVYKGLDPAVRDRIRAAESMLASEYILRCRRLAELSQAAWGSFHAFDALLAPTVAISPPRLDELNDLDNYRRCNLLALRNTSIANLLTLCSLTLPVGRDALGLPVGLQLLAPSGQDVGLVSLALGVEEALTRAA